MDEIAFTVQILNLQIFFGKGGGPPNTPPSALPFLFQTWGLISQFSLKSNNHEGERRDLHTMVVSREI